MIPIPKIEDKTHFMNLPRRKVRYWLFRFQTETVEGVSANGAPAGLKEHFEKIPGFTGWKEFAVSWDLPHLDTCSHNGFYRVGKSCSCSRNVVPLKPVPLLFSIWDQWRATLRTETQVLQLSNTKPKGSKLKDALNNG